MTKPIEQITLIPVPQEELNTFKQELQEAFMKGLQDSFPEAEDPTEMGPIPSEEDFAHSLTSKDSVVLQFVLNGKRIGGVVLILITKRNEMKWTSCT